jgi:hypothetical protein
MPALMSLALISKTLPQPVRPISSSYLQTRSRINALIDQHLSIDILSDRLSDLPTQFTHPHQRSWEPIHWKLVQRSQIIGISPDLFVQVLAGATEIEVPIRSYAEESWSYVQHIHPPMATFMGGSLGETVHTPGIWEKEERQHAPAFGKIYQQLTGEKLQPKPNTVQGYQSSGQPWHDLNQHLISRIATEWSATSVYLWLMAHSTGELHHAIAQPMQDEVNHLAKFWGFSRWVLANNYRHHVVGSSQSLASLLRHHQDERSQASALRHLNRSTVQSGIELGFTLSRVMVRLRKWDRELSHSYLRHLLGTSSGS